MKLTQCSLQRTRKTIKQSKRKQEKTIENIKAETNFKKTSWSFKKVNKVVTL